MKRPRWKAGDVRTTGGHAERGKRDRESSWTVDERAKRILAKVSHAAERVEDMAGSLSSRFPTYSDNIHDDWSPKDFPQGYVLGMRRDLDYMRQQCRALVKFVAQVQALTGAEPLEIEGEGEQVIQ